RVVPYSDPEVHSNLFPKSEGIEVGGTAPGHGVPNGHGGVNGSGGGVAAAPTPVKKELVAVDVLEKTRRIAEARLKGYEGDPCSSCGSMTLVRNGTCLKCNTCGATSGCS